MTINRDRFLAFHRSAAGGTRPLTFGAGLQGALLCAYALFGKGAAYVGVEPFYVGEFALLCGVLCFVRKPRSWQSFLTWPSAVLVLYMVWGLCRTIPYVGEYGVYAFRDGVLWAYGIFAFTVAGFILAEPTLLFTATRILSRFSTVYLMLMPAIGVLFQTRFDVLPRVGPAADATFPHFKAGDSMVHLAAITAAFVFGTIPSNTAKIALLVAGIVLCSYSRAAILAYAAAMIVLFLLKPAHKWWTIAALFAGASTILLALTDVSIPITENREISFRQLTENVNSLLTGTELDAGSRNGTKVWRLQWWDKIIGYTIHGDLLWTGKGFGINLATSDNILTGPERGIRSPHNGHLTVLARSGVIGLSLWVTLNLLWAIRIVGYYRLSRLWADTRWNKLFGVLLVYWAAFMVNAAFDVYLEGPVGGIWYWSVFGVGIAAPMVCRRRVPVLKLRRPTRQAIVRETA
ncbi:MAG TPA: O-antigen ligase family protein [Bryobacteraceae bacterium]|jgi:hypothetical protein|nr:O-antigen ligase family protein [Bryobacteraceae bacterium]